MAAPDAVIEALDRRFDADVRVLSDGQNLAAGPPSPTERPLTPPPSRARARLAT